MISFVYFSAKSKLLEEEVKISSSFFNELNELKIIIQNSDNDVIKYKEEIGKIKVRKFLVLSFRLICKLQFVYIFSMMVV